MRKPYKLRAGGPTTPVPAENVFDGWERQRFQTLRVGTWRNISGTTPPWIQGTTELVLRTRIGDMQRLRQWHLGPMEELTIDVSMCDDATLEVKSSDLVGYDLLCWLDDTPPAGHIDTTANWYQNVPVAGDYMVPRGALRVALSAVDAGWRWLGRVSEPPGTTIALMEAAGFISGDVKGYGFRSTVAGLGVSWTIGF